jgi:hypothetical protein
MVRLISMAMTGYYRTMQRPRAHQPLSMLKYDPIGTIPPRLPRTHCYISHQPEVQKLGLVWYLWWV